MGKFREYPREMSFHERQYSRVCHNTVVVALVQRSNQILLLAEAEIPFLHQFFLHHKPGGSVNFCSTCAQELFPAGVGSDLLMEDQDLSAGQVCPGAEFADLSGRSGIFADKRRPKALLQQLRGLIARHSDYEIHLRGTGFPEGVDPVFPASVYHSAPARCFSYLCPEHTGIRDPVEIHILRAQNADALLVLRRSLFSLF